MPNPPEDQTVAGKVAAAMSAAAQAEIRDGVLQLARELRRFDRVRAGSRGAEFPHDEAYTPGYHEGGARFGFFNGKDEADAAPPAPAPSPKAGDES